VQRRDVHRFFVSVGTPDGKIEPTLAKDASYFRNAGMLSRESCS